MEVIPGFKKAPSHGAIFPNVRMTADPLPEASRRTTHSVRPVHDIHSEPEGGRRDMYHGTTTHSIPTGNTETGLSVVNRMAMDTMHDEDQCSRDKSTLIGKILGLRRGERIPMAKNKSKTRSQFDLEDIMDMMGRRSLRRAFYRSFDNTMNLAMGVAYDTFHEFAENNLYTSLTVFGHFDTFISKSSTKVLLKYLYPKYGKHILMDVDGNFAMCSISIEKIKKSVLGFPELVNKTIRPGIYWVKVSDVGKGTYMIVLKNKLFNEGDISENGIRSEAKNFKTTIIFVGERKIGWKLRVQKEIDGYCSNLVTTSSSSDKIRVQSMGGGDNSQNDIIIRPMTNLMFPQKEAMLDRIQAFLDSGKIYKDNGIPYRKGYLLVGPRGTGKTSFAFSLADYFHMECVSVDLSYFDSNGGANAFNGSNTIYIIDEIDAQLPKSRVAETHEAITVDQQKIIDRLHKLLKAMDDMGDGCIIIGTTNFPERLDPAIVRSGRFDEQITFDNLDKKYAVMMCKNRGLNPDEILDGESFPINPAYLEQKLIDALLLKNNIVTKQLKSADQVIADEYGVDAVRTEEFSDSDMRPYTVKELFEIIDGEIHCADINISYDDFCKVVGLIMDTDVSDDTNLPSAAISEIREEFLSNRSLLHEHMNMIAAKDGLEEETSEDDDDEDVPGVEEDTHYEVIKSEENDARMVEDTEDDSDDEDSEEAEVVTED